jgi:hypothetical protein
MHLLAAAFNALVEAGDAARAPIYIVVPLLLDHIREGYDAGNYGERFAAVRANRMLAIALQTPGLSEDAARFDLRAQLLQPQILRR